MKPNKFIYLYVLQGYYACGFEDLTADETLAGIKQSLREYQDNEGGCYRIVKRREANPLADTNTTMETAA